MQFQVPQFIEVEDKIFGPLTFKQFVYIAGSAGIGYMLYRVFPIYVAAPFIMGILGFGAALAFFKYNGQPFILALEHGFFYLVRGKLYLWSNEPRVVQKVETPLAQAASSQIYVPKLSDSRLHELAWSLDIKERIAAGVADQSERGGALPQNLVTSMRTARDALIN